MEVTYRRPPWLTGSYHPRSAQHRAELPDDGRVQQAGPGPPPPPPTARQLASLPVSAPVWQPYGGPRQLLPRLALDPAMSIRAHLNRSMLRQPCAPTRAQAGIRGGACARRRSAAGGRTCAPLAVFTACCARRASICAYAPPPCLPMLHSQAGVVAKLRAVLEKRRAHASGRRKGTSHRRLRGHR